MLTFILTDTCNSALTAELCSITLFFRQSFQSHTHPGCKHKDADRTAGDDGEEWEGKEDEDKDKNKKKEQEEEEEETMGKEEV